MSSDKLEPLTEDLCIVVGSDDRYAIGLAVTIHSVLANLSQTAPIRLIVVDGGITPSNRSRLERVVSSARTPTRMDWHNADGARFEGLKVSKWGSTANYLRLLIPELVGDQFARVLYLDSDLLVRDDVSALSTTPASADHAVAAVRDYHHRFARTVFGEDGCAEIGIDPATPYFNSGVLVLDTGAWRADRVSERAVEFVRRHSAVMKHSDQDALNAIMPGQWGVLDDTWNVMLPSLGRLVSQTVEDPRARRHRRHELLQSGRVFHFTGARKPWLPGYLGPGGHEFRDALYASGWFDSGGERLIWAFSYWVRSPAGWIKEGYRRLRRSLARAYRSIRPESGRS